MKLIDAAHQAPSSNNLQPWEFIVVTEERAKQVLATAVSPGNVPVVQNAGATFVCLGSMRQQDALAKRMEETVMKQPDPERRARAMGMVVRLREDEQLRRENVLTNTYIGIAQLVLAAQQFGLGTLWMGGFQADEVKRVMEIPADYLVVSLVSVGWPVQEPQAGPRNRRPLAEVYWLNRFGVRE